jgi:Tfp pilus assembly protein FimV
VIPSGKSSGLLAGSSLEDRSPRRARAQGRTAPRPVPQAAALAPARHVPEGVYVVQQGDTLWSIAAKFGTTVDRLKRLNGLHGRRARALHIGQEIAVKEGV